MHAVSSGSEIELEETAAATPTPKIFQLYVRGDADWVDDHVRRSIDNGYAAFCLTVDTAHYSRRERDLAKRHVTAGATSAPGSSIGAGSVKRCFRFRPLAAA